MKYQITVSTVILTIKKALWRAFFVFYQFFYQPFGKKIKDIMNDIIYKEILETNMLLYVERRMPQNWYFQFFSTQKDNDFKHENCKKIIVSK